MTEDSENQTIDTEELMEIMDDDTDLVRECFNDFIKISPKMLAKIKTSIDTEDAEDLDQFAHKFKGTLKYLAAFPAADLAYELEKMGKEKQFEKANSTLSALERECENINQFISKF